MNNQIAKAMLRYKTHVSDMKENYCRELSMRSWKWKLVPLPIYCKASVQFILGMIYYYRSISNFLPENLYSIDCLNVPENDKFYCKDG